MGLMMLRDFAEGKMPASKLQEYAHAAVKSGANAPDLAKMAQLGAYGNSSQNAHRDLMKFAFSNVMAPRLTFVETNVSFRDLATGERKVTPKNVPVLLLGRLPHLWIESLDKGGVLESITASTSALKQYWSEVNFKSPQMKDPFWKTFSVQKELPIPLLIHGDHASFSETDSMLVVSIRCLISDRSIKSSELLLACLPKDANAGSWTALWKELAASLSVLAAGKHPDGKPLRRCVLMAVAGDLEFFAQEFGWPTALSNQPCPYCKADNLFNKDKEVAPFNDFRPCAAWRGMLKAHLFGNLLYDLGQDELPGSSLLERIMETYVELGIPANRRIPKIAKTNLVGASDYPCLLHIKGRKIRDFADVAVVLANKFTGMEEGRHRAEACKAMKTLYDLADRKEWFWSSKNHEKFDKAVHAFLSHYAYLAKAAFRKGKTRYSIVQKFHLLAHFPEQCRWATPRTCWTYGPESFMSIVKRIASSCDRGTAAWQVPEKVCSKFALFHDLILKGWLDMDQED
ncbi:unnamed protein product [Symbiodinium natans]|uniref:Uncharacterized protein n=1 Tax=Symbiodinium natans TaxID=878477 RepID=A0A812U9X8_9DINO|nr:unnamed protein product [Symbiodinium natans]